MSDKYPIALSESEAKSLKLETAEQYRNLHCVFYDDCLDMADKENWPGFCCSECTAYKAIDQEQKARDFVGLFYCSRAIENVNEIGKVNRRRGVKPGNANPPEPAEETGSLAEAFPKL